jgi:hypothetical protein
VYKNQTYLAPSFPASFYYLEPKEFFDSLKEIGFTDVVVIDPLTRIEGHLKIEVEVENGKVVDAHVLFSPRQSQWGKRSSSLCIS